MHQKMYLVIFHNSQLRNIVSCFCLSHYTVLFIFMYIILMEQSPKVLPVFADPQEKITYGRIGMLPTPPFYFTFLNTSFFFVFF